MPTAKKPGKRSKPKSAPKANPHHKATLHLKKSDPILAAIIERVGPCRIEFREPTFHSLARSILYQQLNGTAALTIFNRFTALAGDPLTPQGILKMTDAQMREVGLSRQKTSYLRDLSEKTHAGLLEFDRIADMTEEDVIAHLTQVKGVGVWTAHMFLMFTLRRPDILPTGDYAVQAAMKKLYKKRKWPKPDVMHKIAKPWAPYRSIACWYLWRSFDIKTV
ncbi:MAG: DNA-3-methyladenine glycosylase [Terriglobales bacterium]|jgi:DNA-3-methyladenine glycosylase II